MAVSSKLPMVCVRILDVPMLTILVHRIMKAQCVVDYQKQPAFWECGICVCRAAQCICQGEKEQLTAKRSREQMTHEICNYREWMLETLNQIFGVNKTNNWGEGISSYSLKVRPHTHIHIHTHTRKHIHIYPY